jgi:hypothetical protein
VDPVAHHHQFAPGRRTHPVPRQRHSRALPVTTLTQTLAQLAVVIFGILVLLNLLGISITPILTALGVGGLAVALALQDTLSNLFAGFYVAVAPGPAGRLHPPQHRRGRLRDRYRLAQHHHPGAGQ